MVCINNQISSFSIHIFNYSTSNSNPFEVIMDFCNDKFDNKGCTCFPFFSQEGKLLFYYDQKIKMIVPLVDGIYMNNKDIGFKETKIDFLEIIKINEVLIIFNEILENNGTNVTLPSNILELIVDKMYNKIPEINRQFISKEDIINSLSKKENQKLKPKINKNGLFENKRIHKNPSIDEIYRKEVGDIVDLKESDYINSLKEVDDISNLDRKINHFVKVTNKITGVQRNFIIDNFLIKKIINEIIEKFGFNPKKDLVIDFLDKKLNEIIHNVKSIVKGNPDIQIKRTGISDRDLGKNIIKKDILNEAKEKLNVIDYSEDNNNINLYEKFEQIENDVDNLKTTIEDSIKDYIMEEINKAVQYSVDNKIVNAVNDVLKDSNMTNIIADNIKNKLENSHQELLLGYNTEQNNNDEKIINQDNIIENFSENKNQSESIRVESDNSQYSNKNDEITEKNKCLEEKSKKIVTEESKEKNSLNNKNYEKQYPNESEKSTKKSAKSAKSDTKSPKSDIKSPKSDTKSVTDEKSSKSNTKSAKSDIKSAKTDTKSAKSEKSDTKSVTDEKSVKSDTKSSKSDTKSVTDEKSAKTDIKSAKTVTKSVKSDEKSDTKSVTDEKSAKSDTKSIKSDTKSTKSDEKSVKSDTKSVKSEDKSTKSGDELVSNERPSRKSSVKLKLLALEAEKLEKKRVLKSIPKKQVKKNLLKKVKIKN